MKTDRKGVPYRTVFDQFLSPAKRLTKAINTSDVDWVLALCNTGNAPLNYRLTSLERPEGMSSNADNGTTLMHWFVHHKSYAGVECLLKQQFDPNIGTFFRETPAHWAADDGNEELLLLLFEYGADFALCKSQRGSFMFEDPYCPNVFEIFKSKTGRNLSQEELSARVLHRHIEESVTCTEPARKRKM